MKRFTRCITRRLAATHWSTWALIAITLTALALRLAVVWSDRNMGVPFGARTDSGTYLRMAQQWSRGRPRIAGEEANYYFTPGYPAFLGFLMRLRLYFGIEASVRVLAGLIQAFLGAWTVLLIGLLARKRISAPTGVLAALILAIWPGQVLGSTTLMTEPLFTPIIWTVATLFLWSSKPSRPQLWSVGFLLAAAMLVRPTAAPVLLCCLAITYLRGTQPWRRRLSNGGVLLLGAAYILGPWFAVTTLTTGQPLLTTSTGFNFCLGNSDGANGTFREKVCETPRGQPSAEYDAHLRNEAFKWALSHPGEEFKLLGQRHKNVWSYGDEYFAYQDSIDHNVPFTPKRVSQMEVSRGFWEKAVWLALMGLVAGLTLCRGFRLMVVLAASMMVMTYITFGSSRFHDPVVPLMAVCIAILAVEPIRQLIRSDRI